MNCPKCSGVRISTERRPNGNHVCGSCGHTWPNQKEDRKTDGMTFGLALEILKKNGPRICRKNWNGKGMWLRVVIPGGDNKEFDMGMENLPYVELKTADNKLVPWVPSQTDILAEDWQIVD